MIHIDDSRFDENDLEDVDDIMDYYRLDTRDLIGLGDAESPVEKTDDYDESYYLDTL